jgi:hypothetical protein
MSFVYSFYTETNIQVDLSYYGSKLIKTAKKDKC